MLVKQLFAILTCVPAHAGNPPSKRGPALPSSISQTVGKTAAFKTHAPYLGHLVNVVAAMQRYSSTTFD